MPYEKYAVEIKNLFYTYPGGVEALKGLSVRVPLNSKTALLGPNGAGKTTLIFHLNGIFLPQKGEVYVLGQEVSRKTEKELKTKVGLVFQDPDDQLFAPTVWEDAAFGPLNMGLKRDEVEKRVEEALKQVGAYELKDRPPYMLSYGEKKRAAIAGVLAMDPEIIVLDEPWAFLDPLGQEQIGDILTRLHEKGKTIILATHDVDFAAQWADWVIVIRDGMLVAEGEPSLLTEEGVVFRGGLRYPLITRLFKEAKLMEGDKLPYTLDQGIEIIRKLLEEGLRQN
ncbi:MAG TPA: energy-coupling factor ABC transporter ATP-binding protein [Peptococcaceae bacterium]|nr:MAG: Cobalt ABC transporter, ATPase subunit [Clostridia bacterium 41_269]HBT20919.1 energy-coupling factor ABC transporter ATP-binding protein [Peptococcaceae bacterium]